MKLASIALAAGLGIGLAGAALPAGDARAGGSFGLYTPGFSLYIGKGHRYGHRYYRHRYYKPYRYKRHRYRSRRSGRCGHWARRCASNWGWRNSNWRGCMRYYGCR